MEKREETNTNEIQLKFKAIDNLLKLSKPKLYLLEKKKMQFSNLHRY